MPFPNTTEGLVRAGYVFDNTGRCKSCQVEIDWWITPSKGRMPLDHGTTKSHFATCPQAGLFRKDRKAEPKPRQTK